MAFVVPLAFRGEVVLRSVSAAATTRGSLCRRQHASIRAAASMSSRTEQELVKDVLEHWFGSATVARFDPLKEQRSLWYGSSEEIDNDIRRRFGDDVQHALDGGWDQLIGGSQHPITGELALVIMLDQYTRNIYRGSAKAYAGDEKSLQVVQTIFAPERWPLAKQVLSPTQCASLLMPLMHQESLEHLTKCDEKAAELVADCEAAGEAASECAESLKQLRDYTERHRKIVAQFGRYPYRNEVLGRTCTPDELVFLENGPRFGQ